MRGDDRGVGLSGENVQKGRHARMKEWDRRIELKERKGKGINHCLHPLLPLPPPLRRRHRRPDRARPEETEAQRAAS